MMLNQPRKATLLQLALVFSLTLFAATTRTSAQTVVYDWSGNSKVPESYPKITRKQRVSFRITNVNDILYSYRLEVTQTPNETDDFKLISGLFSLFTSSKSASRDSCSSSENAVKDALQKAMKAISEDPKLPVGYSKSSPHKSIPLKDSVDAWRSHGESITKAVDLAEDFLNNCPANDTLRQAYLQFKKSVEKINNAVNSSHEFTDFHEISPGNNVSVLVVEMFESETISTKTFTFPGSDVLTLSAGALFSTIPDRSYEARKTPTADENVLTVEGNSKANPSLVALLNYSLGALRLDGETAGLALSAGPVIRLGTKSDASSFGFFSGISGHLYHRFYVTPGIHFGQFADFPVGFGNGSTIPQNFGELTPVKRWTARFGLAISFKTKDFSGLTSSDAPTVASAQTGGSTKPKEPATPSPDTAARVNDVSEPNFTSSSIAKRFLRTVPERQPPPKPPQQATAEYRHEPEPETVSFYLASSDDRNSVTHITSVQSIVGSLTGERLLVNATSTIKDYSMYFNRGRFYLVIPHARLDVIEDGLRGRVFSEPVIERRGNDLILSLDLLPGTRASVIEGPGGLELVLSYSARN